MWHTLQILTPNCIIYFLVSCNNLKYLLNNEPVIEGVKALINYQERPFLSPITVGSSLNVLICNAYQRQGGFRRATWVSTAVTVTSALMSHRHTPSWPGQDDQETLHLERAWGQRLFDQRRKVHKMERGECWSCHFHNQIWPSGEDTGQLPASLAGQFRLSHACCWFSSKASGIVCLWKQKTKEVL